MNVTAFSLCFEVEVRKQGSKFLDKPKTACQLTTRSLSVHILYVSTIINMLFTPRRSVQLQETKVCLVVQPSNSMSVPRRALLYLNRTTRR